MSIIWLNVQVLLTSSFEMSDLVHEGVRYGNSGRDRSRHTVMLGNALVQSCNAEDDMVEIALPDEERKTMSCVNATVINVLSCSDGKAWMREP